MLQHLSIRNYALIQELEVPFKTGLLTVTGETGAGKSIVLGALSLALGHRADTSVIEGKSNKCIVEAEFDISAYGLQAFFEENDLDYETPTTLRREINLKGKSRAFINDTPVSLNQLKSLGEALVDIHTQHETLSLKDKNYQLSILDSYASNESELKAYQEAYHKHREIQKEYERKSTSDTGKNIDVDFIRFQHQELVDAALKAAEQEELEEEAQVLEHAGEIAKTAFEGAGMLQEQEQSVVAQLQDLKANLKQLTKFDSRFESLFERLESAQIELQDIAAELESIADTTNADESRLTLVTERLNLIHGLQKKHRLNSVEELIQKTFALEDELHDLEHLDEVLEELRKQLDQSEQAVKAAGERLSESRKNAIAGLTDKLHDLLKQVGMPNARISVELEPTQEFQPKGLDIAVFRFSSNPGSSPLPIYKVASGGELSRLMLCLKSILADSQALPTLIFDEIDTGISGEVAAKVARLLRVLAKGHQLISITHLPQIAGAGEHHYYVHKEVKNGTTHTGMRLLDEEERLDVLASMLSGETTSDSAKANAREMLSASNKS